MLGSCTNEPGAVRRTTRATYSRKSEPKITGNYNDSIVCQSLNRSPNNVSVAPIDFIKKCRLKLHKKIFIKDCSTGLRSDTSAAFERWSFTCIRKTLNVTADSTILWVRLVYIYCEQWVQHDLSHGDVHVIVIPPTSIVKGLHIEGYSVPCVLDAWDGIPLKEIYNILSAYRG